MACNDCNSTTNGCVCQPGRAGEPGPPNTISISVSTLPAGSDPVVVPSGVSPVQHFAIGFPLSPLPNITATAVEGTPTGVVVGGTPQSPVLNFTIAPGADGENGWGTAFELLDSFNMPAPGGTTGFITIGDNRMVEVGTWVKITGYSIEGNWFVVTAKSGDDQAQFRNPGPADLLPYWGVATDVPSNAPPGTLFSAGELGVVVGAPGLRGLEGVSGWTPRLAVVNVVPTLAPVSEAEAMVFVANASPPAQATSFTPYMYDYNTLTWVEGPNIAGPPGSTTYFQAADPNLVPIPGSNIGDGNWSILANTAILRMKTSISAWATVGTISLMGTATTAVTWTTGPGTYTLDLGVFSYDIQADSDIELDWDDANYSGQGIWTVVVNNHNGAAPINVSFATGERWNYLKNMPTAPTPALSLPDTESVVIQFVRDSFGAVYTITSFDILLAI